MELTFTSSSLAPNLWAGYLYLAGFLRAWLHSELFLFKAYVRLFFLYNRDKCRKPGFLRGDLYTSCISMILLDHFVNKSNTFLFTINGNLWLMNNSFCRQIVIVAFNLLLVNILFKTLYSTTSPNLYIHNQVSIVWTPYMMELVSDRVRQWSDSAWMKSFASSNDDDFYCFIKIPNV